MSDIDSEYDVQLNIFRIEKEMAAMDAALKENIWRLHDNKRLVKSIENSIQVSEQALAVKRKELADLKKGE